MLVRDSGGCSALHKAAQNGHTELVSYILQQGEAVHDVHGGRNATKNSLKKTGFHFLKCLRIIFLNRFIFIIKGKLLYRTFEPMKTA